VSKENTRSVLRKRAIITRVPRNPYCQAFDLRSGEIVELDVDAAGLVYLMTAENMPKYCAGRDDFIAEASMPFANPIELVARKAGRWFLVSEDLLQGSYRLRRGLESKAGRLQMYRAKPSNHP
jgi:hypothetical protein